MTENLLESPAFAPGATEAIDAALKNIGHAVVRDVWPPDFLEALRQATAAAFAEADELYRRGMMPAEVAQQHLGSFMNVESLPRGAALDSRFYATIARSPLRALYRHLLSGDFVISRYERLVRRFDPRFPIRFVGLHYDGQLNALSSRGLRTTRELTLWTPLQDCADDDIARLLLIHRGENCGDFLASNRVSINGMAFHPVQLRPRQYTDETAGRDALGDFRSEYARLFSTRRCYAPLVPLGSAVLFERDVLHGSYLPEKITRPRYSLDFRAVGEYEMTAETALFPGRRFSRWRVSHVGL